MSKISINVNKIEKQIKELGNISSNMDGIIDRMEAVISSDVMSEQTFLPLKKNIEKEIICCWRLILGRLLISIKQQILIIILVK